MFFQTPEMPSNEILSTFTASAMVVSVIQWLKNTKLVPFINQHSAGMNRTLSWLAAFFSGLGIHYHYDATAGALTITGLTAGVILHTGWDATQQYFAQWLIYRGIVKGPAADVAAVAEGVPVTPVASPGLVQAGAVKAKDIQAGEVKDSGGN